MSVGSTVKQHAPAMIDTKIEMIFLAVTALVTTSEACKSIDNSLGNIPSSKRMVTSL